MAEDSDNFLFGDDLDAVLEANANDIVDEAVTEERQIVPEFPSTNYGRLINV